MSFIIYSQFNAHLINQAENELTLTVKSVNKLMNNTTNRQIDEIRDHEYGIIMFNKNNQVANESEWLSFINEVSGVKQIHSDQINMHDKQLLIVGHFSPQSTIMAYRSLDTIAQTLTKVEQLLFMIGLLLLIVFSAFSYLLSKRLSEPLSKMRKTALTYAKGDFNLKLPMNNPDEIGELAMAFNRMGRQLSYQLNALKQEKEILSNILRSMHDGVLTLNLDGEIIISNPQANQFIADFLYQENQVSTRQIPDQLYDFIQDVIKKSIPQSYHLKIQGRDWTMVISPLYEEQSIRGVVAIVRDVTEQNQLDQLRESFLANISHELRTPISLMQGYSEAIIDGVARSREEQIDLAQIILDESLRMGRLVNELLDLAKLKSGQIDLIINSYSISEFLARIIRKFKVKCTNNGISFSFGNNATVDEIPFDRDRLEQVLTNLIDNAIRHTPVNGEIKLILTEANDNLIFELHDTGSGIPEQDLPFIFERFYKADKSRSRTQLNKKGTGLGLAIAKQIVEAHGGQISAQSKLDRGTTFKFSLPKNNL
ncbi:HAMP domain-containing sensor histidine kinase [Amphibacillus cookii]|uniref:HAMP domain-containing sensor histidine kinase n=1 Tax=Amphibacillus cookii TaxID=767787 RepID=UPI001EF7D780|nr:ATP-binding protein [Amphibacillus cookii]MBM7542487.1 two-component system sensor histidine kinase ResE [Amphibacillus cookii]